MRSRVWARAAVIAASSAVVTAGVGVASVAPAAAATNPNTALVVMTKDPLVAGQMDMVVDGHQLVRHAVFSVVNGKLRVSDPDADAPKFTTTSSGCAAVNMANPPAHMVTCPMPQGVVYNQYVDAGTLPDLGVSVDATAIPASMRMVTIYGSAQTDVLQLNAGPNTVYAFGGNDVVIGGASSTVYGGDGNDVILGGVNSTVFGGDGNDTYIGGAGATTFYGGTTQQGSPADGNDTYVSTVADAPDQFFGGGGSNTADYSHRSDPVEIAVGSYVADAAHNHLGDTVTQISNLIGGSGNDVLDAFEQPGVTVHGGPGNDTIRGSVGGDLSSQNCGETLYGDDGDDVIYPEGDNVCVDGGTGTNRVSYVDSFEHYNAVAAVQHWTQLTGGVSIVKAVAADQSWCNCQLVAHKSTGTDAISNVSLIDGTKYDDTIDVSWLTRFWGISAGAGNDHVVATGTSGWFDGGAGNDVITSSYASGPSVFTAGPGDDLVRADNRVQDMVIDCGTGNDQLFADLNDPAATGCESSTRS